MDEFKPDAEERSRRKPFRRTNFALERIVALTERRKTARKERSRPWLRYAAACTAALALAAVVLIANGVVPNPFLRTAGPSDSTENPAGNVYDPLKLKTADTVASMTVASVDVRKLRDGTVFADILFDSDVLEISGTYAVVSAASDGDAEAGGLTVVFDPAAQSVDLFPYHNLFAHDIRLYLTHAEDIGQFGSIGQSGEAVIRISGFRDRAVGKDDIVQNTTLVEVVGKAPLQDELEPPQELPDASYADFSIPVGLLTGLRDLEDARTEPNTVYRLHEYQVTGSLETVEKWLRDETERLGGTLIERYTYEAGLQPDFILKLPSKEEGTRIVSTYAPKYENEQRLVVLESTFGSPVEFGADTEDHALIVATPDKNGNTHETFLANYPHQHTDIYSVYFYSQAFFAQLEEDGYGLSLNYDISGGVPDYAVGYFDAQGKEVSYDDLTDANRDTVTFGIQLNADFLPKSAAERKLLLRCWAETALMGDKAQSSVYDGELALNFLMNGKVFDSFTVSDLLKRTVPN